MKKFLSLLSLCMAILTLGGCSGIGLFAKSEIGPSEKFTKQEIAEAVRVVRKSACDDSFLYRITYDEKRSDSAIETFQFIASLENTIVLYSDFYTGNARNGLNPFDIYTGYSWVLTREGPGEKWQVVSCGYG